MSSRSPVASARPKPSAQTSLEKDEGKEARQTNTACETSEATPLSRTRRATAMTRDAVSRVTDVSASESRTEASSNKTAAQADGSSKAEDGGVTSSAGTEVAASTSAPAAGGTSNGGQVAAAAAGAASEGNGELNMLKGKKVLKTMGPNRVVEGHVHGYVPAHEGQEEKWMLKWDDDDQADEEVPRAELDKWINLHNVRTWSKGTKKRDRAARPQTTSTPVKRAVKKRQKQATPSPSVKRGRSRSPKVNGAASPNSSPKTRSTTGSSSSSGTTKKKARVSSKASPRASSKASSANGAGVKTEGLQGNASDVGKLVAKEFTEGIFTGEVTKVKPGSSTYWSIRYEDDDFEDLDEKEMATCTKLYELLLAKFVAAPGRDVTSADEDAEKEGDDPVNDEGQDASKKGKGKGKAKGESKGGGSAAADDSTKLLGTQVRKFFVKYGEFDGKVTKHFAPEGDGDDDLGDLWLVEYDDGDAEHMNLVEIRQGEALYQKHHALVRKEIELPTGSGSGKKATNIPQKAATLVLYAERPKDSRLFAKIKNYRKWRS